MQKMYCFDRHNLGVLVKILKEAHEEFLKEPQSFLLCPQCAKDLKPLQQALNEFLSKIR